MVRTAVDQSWSLALPLLFGAWMVGSSLNWYREGAGERWLKGSTLLETLGPGVITAPIGIGISAILFPIAYFLWPVAWARDLAMVLLLTSFILGWLSFAWSPRRLLPRWLQPSVRTPAWVVSVGRASRSLVGFARQAASPASKR